MNKIETSSTQMTCIKAEKLNDTDELFQNDSQDFTNSICSRNEQQVKYFINKRWKYIYRDEIKNFERLKYLNAYFKAR